MLQILHLSPTDLGIHRLSSIILYKSAFDYFQHRSYDVSEPVYGGSVVATKMRAFSDPNLRYELDSSDPYVSIPVKFYVTAELQSPQPDMILQVSVLALYESDA